MEPIFPIYQVNSFVYSAYTGNPAGVCYLMWPRSDEWMQKVAKEMNLSETAFFSQKENHFQLRWFTPTTEVDLCGHATLATAFIIWEKEIANPNETLVFETKSGELTCRREGEWIVMDFPAENGPETDPDPLILEALGITEGRFFRNRMDVMVVVEKEEIVRKIRPDMQKLAQADARGIIVTAKYSGTEADFISRFFGPACGVPEDPVTGSAHCFLGPWWANVLNKKEVTGYQASGRGGIVRVEVLGERVLLKGKAVMFMQGMINDSSSAGPDVVRAGD